MKTFLATLKRNRLQVDSAKQERTYARIMVTLSLVFLVALLLVPIGSMTAYTLAQITPDNQQQIQRELGKFDLSHLNLNESPPVSLEGTWFSYAVPFLSQEKVDSFLFSGRQVAALPLADFSKSSGTLTYQCYVKFQVEDNHLNPPVLAIQFLKPDVSVYLNGHRIAPYTPYQSYLGLQAESTTAFALDEFYNPDLEYQEILLSVNNEEEDTDLYNRPIILTSYANSLYLDKTNNLYEFFFMGICLTLMLVGFIYIIMRPSRSALTMINLFDTSLMVYVILAHTSIPAYVALIAPAFAMEDFVVKGASIFFLCLTGALGNDLTVLVFPGKRVIPRWFGDPLNVTLVFCGIFFALRPFFYPQMLMFSILFFFAQILYAIANRVLFIYRQGEMNPYQKYQTGVTCYIMLVGAIDVLLINSSSQYKSTLLGMYILFVLQHLFVRAYEYALPLKQIAETNKNLEKTIAERTKELIQTNQVLRDLSIRDSLTNAYNRMYFENEFLDYLEKFHSQWEEITSLHLCIFDLDNFKQINDNYGHATGDTQLKKVIEITSQELPDEVVTSRIGGEEFTLLFPNYDDQQVLESVETIRLALERLSRRQGRTTGSFGVTRAGADSDKKSVFVQADECLYYSKAHGKNCISHDFQGSIVRLSRPTDSQDP